MNSERGELGNYVVYWINAFTRSPSLRSHSIGTGKVFHQTAFIGRQSGNRRIELSSPVRSTGWLPVELAHEDTLVQVRLTEADNVVDDALQTETEHASSQVGG
jgi:hypothetical protein